MPFTHIVLCSLYYGRHYVGMCGIVIIVGCMYMPMIVCKVNYRLINFATIAIDCAHFNVVHALALCIS